MLRSSIRIKGLGDLLGTRSNHNENSETSKLRKDIGDCSHRVVCLN